MLTRFGLGCRRLIGGDQFALVEGLKKRQCNVIDVGAGWAGGASSRAAGDALFSVFDSEQEEYERAMASFVPGSGDVEPAKPLVRGDVHIVAKLGWLEGPSLARAVELLSEVDKSLLQELVPMTAQIAFCFHPVVLEDQLSTLLGDLGVQSVDSLLLDHPEHYLLRHADPTKRGSPVHFRAMLRQAFAQLEAEAQRGRIGRYGVASDRLGDQVRVDELAAEARAAAGSDQCRLGAVQYPLNVVDGHSPQLRQAQQSAADAGLLQFACRPLHAAQSPLPGASGPVRLYQPADHSALDFAGLLKEAFDYSIHIEKSYPLIENPHVPGYRSLPPPSDVSWAQIIAANQANLGNLAQWLDVRDFQIRPALERAFEVIYKDRHLLWWSSKYKPAVNRLLDRFTWMLEHSYAPSADAIKAVIDRRHPELAGLALDQQALAFAASDPFVTTTIVSVRQPAHLSRLPVGQ